MKTSHPIFILLASFISIVGFISAQETPTPHECSMHSQHVAEESHEEIVQSHGDQAMHFPHDKTTHHFHMLADGGVIEVTVNDPNDKTNQQAIRGHLAHIAEMFNGGNFSVPMFVHDGIPPGATIMAMLKGKISYEYEETARGGKLRIKSTDPIAVAAIHDFLRFQITDHHTGDTLTVVNTQ
jgi:TusA-related sulfurtransferase